MPHPASEDPPATAVDSELDSELRRELGSIASFIERVAQTPAFAPGELLEIAASDPDLELSERIGAGGVGVVYLARDRKLDREVAVKVQRISGNREADDRLLSEARALARLAHPNVVSVFEVRRVDGHLLVLMELVRGPTLREWLAGGDRKRAEIIATFAAAGAGLQAAHQAGVVHRDFKPENVIVGDDGRVRVVDFGMAGEAGEREQGGTPAYMAPEQAAGDAVDARADQYAFCTALLEALSKRIPSPSETADAIAEIRPGWLRDAIDRGLARDLRGRWPDMAALLAALRRPRRWPIAAGAVAAVVALALIVGSRGCAEPLGLFVGRAVGERAALLTARETARRHIADGHQLQAAEALAGIYGEIDDPMIGVELGSAMPGIDSFVRDVDVVVENALDDIALRGDGTRLAVVSNGTTRLLDMADDRVIAEINGEAPRFADRDRWLLTQTNERRLSVWDAETGEPRWSAEIGRINELAVGGDVVFVSVIGAVRAYSVRDGSLLFEDASDGPMIGGLSVSADGQRMLVARVFATLYDRTGKVLLKSAKSLVNARGELAPDGSRFALSLPTKVMILSTDGSTLGELAPTPGAVAVRHAADGKRLLVIGSRESCVWTIDTRRKDGCWTRLTPTPPATTPRLHRLAVSRADGGVDIRDGASGRRRVALAARRDGVSRVQITDDGLHVVTASPEGQVRVWRGDVDTLHGEVVHPPKTHAQVIAGRLVAAGDRSAAIWDLDAPQQPIRALSSDGGAGIQASVSDDGSVAAWSGRTWSLATGEPIAEVADWNPRALLAIDRTGDLLVACADGSCRGINARTGVQRWSLEVAEPLGMGALPASAVSTPPSIGPDSDVLLTGMGSDIVVDPATGAIRRRLEREIKSFGMSSAFLSDRRFVVADGNRIYIAPLDGGEVTSIVGMGHGIVAHPDGDHLITPVRGGALILDTRSREKRRFDVAVEPSGGAAISNDGTLLAIGHSYGLIEIFDIATGRKVADRSAGELTNTLHFTAGDRLIAIARHRTLVWTIPIETRPAAEISAAVDRIAR
jgi:tRNA A-37 threonylcarbamoyl transferase component Bud32/WD40 repeat protein